MSEQNGEPGTPQNPGGENLPNPTPVQADVQKVIGELSGQKKHFQEKSEKLEKELFETQQKLVAQSPAPARSLDAKEFATLLYEGYTEDDITFLETVMKSTGKSAKEVREIPHVKKALEGTKAERQSQQATPVPSSPVSFGGLGRSGPTASSYFEGGKVVNPNPEKPSFKEWQAKRRAGK